MSNEIITEGASVPPPTLEERVRAVHMLRCRLAIQQADVAKWRREWEEKYVPWIDEARQTGEELATAEQALRAAAIAGYLETGDKMPTPGVGIRVTSRPCYDPTAALEWAREHSLALRLDVKTFEAIAKHGACGSLVTYQVEPTAMIASDLSKILEVAE